MKLAFTIFIGVFFLAGLGMLAAALWTSYRSIRASSWPTTEGTITHLELKTKQDEGAVYEVQVEYQYEVGGDRYQGNRLAFGYGTSGGKPTHAALYERLKQAKAVDVRYSPANPAVSTLAHGWHRGLVMRLLGAMGWLALVSVFVAVWWYSSRPDVGLVESLGVR